MRSIQAVIKADRVNMGGILLDQPLPSRNVDMIDPFLLIHHWDQELPGGQKQERLGVGPHPHRGFAPVTFIFNGSVHHRDSEGYEVVVSGGGTQWMNSGQGIVHSERPGKELAEKGGRFELIQFWVNAPAKNKMDKPNFQPLQAEETPWVTSADGKVKTGVIAGEFMGHYSRIQPYSPMLILRFEFEAGGEISIPIFQHYNALVYQLDGKMVVNGTKETGRKDMVWFGNDGENITLKAIERSRMILLSGAPINEPVATYGPFVMNTEREIMDAIHDYQTGKIGYLVEKFD